MSWNQEFLPRQAGELAVLSHPYLPRELAGCQNHVFRVREPLPTQLHQSQSGFLQKGECLACGRTTSLLDASWWEQTPTAEAIAATLESLRAMQNRAAEAARESLAMRIAQLESQVSSQPVS